MKPAGEWPYMNAAGEVVGKTVRYEMPDGVKTYRQFRRNGDGWEPGAMPAPRPLYRLPDLMARADAVVLACEGEKTADAAAQLFPDLAVTTWPGGANAVHLTDWSPLQQRQVLIWPDRYALDERINDAFERYLPPLP